jgi:DnaK suppressor protein
VDIDAARRRLAGERARVLDERKRMEDDVARPFEDASDDDGSDSHMGDSASDTLAREMNLSLEENADRLLSEIDAALGRIDAGTYGQCERCGRPIDSERLEALPYATKCITCKRLEEKG